MSPSGRIAWTITLCAGAVAALAAGPRPSPAGYADLLALRAGFREFQAPRVTAGVPDYTAAAMAAQRAGLGGFRSRLAAIDPGAWPLRERVDYEIVRAEMNGLEFDHRVLRPWARMPGFYVVVQASESDVPAREGPEIPGAIHLWERPFPLDAAGLASFRAQLEAVPAVLAQARSNLVEGTPDLWDVGIRQKRNEAEVLGRLAARLATVHPALVPAVEKARAAVDDFRAWLEARRSGLSGSSGIGVPEFDWYQKNVHLVPYTWAEQLQLCTRELERALAYLQLERRRNAALPPLRPAADREELARRQKEAVAYFFDFLKTHDVFTMTEDMRLDDRVGGWVPPERREYFAQVIYRDPLPLICHSIHWVEKAREKRNADPVRGTPMLYNIWDSRAEGFATAFEELMMGAGLFDRNPRARELVLNLLAFRAVRAICDLRLHSREWTMAQAAKYAAATTPDGWLSAEGDPIWGDLGIYIQQPGYGTSYVVGKNQVERLLGDWSRARGYDGALRPFFDDFFARGIIPQSLLRWEMTGLDDEIRRLRD